MQGYVTAFIWVSRLVFGLQNSNMELVHFKFNCRICLKSRKPFKNVYCHVVDGFQDPLVQMVFALFNVQVGLKRKCAALSFCITYLFYFNLQFETHQAYPQFMCKRCLNRLTHILLFKQEVLRNQETLFDLFKTSHSSYVQQVPFCIHNTLLYTTISCYKFVEIIFIYLQKDQPRKFSRLISYLNFILKFIKILASHHHKIQNFSIIMFTICGRYLTVTMGKISLCCQL